MGSITFRAMQLRSWTGKVEESGPVHRIKFTGDLSLPAARELELDELFFEPSSSGQGVSAREFDGDFSMKGARSITEVRVEPNGLKQHSFELRATVLEYDAYSKQGKDEDGPGGTGFRLSITTNEAFTTVENYARIVGTGDAVIKVRLASNQQMKLTEQPAEEDDDARGEVVLSEWETPAAGPTLAPAAVMGGPRKRRSKAESGDADSAEQVAAAAQQRMKGSVQQ